MKKSTTIKAPKAKVAQTKNVAPIGHGVGRRKTAVARVWLRPGTGKIVVNGEEFNTYFDTEVTRLEASAPFRLLPFGSSFDVDVNVAGGGLCAQADAVKLGTARALLAQDESIRSQLREFDFLTVDSRRKERKKYGQKAARRKFQFVKR
ncbi:30S ribosomal protein S9 [Candidatus Dependentiae bacterium Noda2021]|nr:30S ribosomal protein S9 [Candidatus Dependentiae bacterium Noda2021]